jgi:hypothetical protein
VVSGATPAAGDVSLLPTPDGGCFSPPFSPHTLIFTASILLVTTLSWTASKRVSEGPAFLFRRKTIPI